MQIAQIKSIFICRLDFARYTDITLMRDSRDITIFYC